MTKARTRRLRRGAAVGLLTALALTGAGTLAATTPATATSTTVVTTDAPRGVALYYDPAVVDVGALDDRVHEASNLRASLEKLGHRVTAFTATDADGIRAALRGNSVLAIPSMPWQTDNALADLLDQDALEAIRAWVENGGTMVVLNDRHGLLHEVFGYDAPTLSRDGYSYTLEDQPADSPFAGLPRRLDNGWESTAPDLATLPADAVPIYTIDEPNWETSASVFTVPEGAGTVVSLAWSWVMEPLSGNFTEDYVDPTWDVVLNESVGLGAPLAARPGKVGTVRVAGQPSAAQRQVTWTHPAGAQWSRPTGYTLVVKHADRTLVTKSFGPARTSFALRKGQLRSGQHTVTVRGVNDAGAGPAGARTFRVVR